MGCERDLLVSAGILMIVTLRVANLMITKAKFKQWSVIHIVDNKAAGAILFLALPLCIWLGGIPYWVTAPILVAAFLSAEEETCILIKARHYEVNRKNLWKGGDEA